MGRIWGLLRRRRAATAVEYALLVMLFAGVCLAIVTTSGQRLSDVFCYSANHVQPGACLGGSPGGGDDGGGGGDFTVAYGYSLDCTADGAASCQQVSDDPAEPGPIAAATASCNAAQNPAQLALAAARGLLTAADGIDAAQACTGGDTVAWGFVATCQDATVAFACRGLMRSSPTTLIDGDSADCDAAGPPQDGDAALLQAHGLLPRDATAGYDGSWCTGAPVTAYGWDLYCDDNVANCNGFTWSPQDGEDYDETVDPALCAIESSPEQRSLLEYSYLIPATAGATQQSTLALCTGSTLIYGYDASCDNAHAGFDCVATYPGAPGSWITAPQSSCDAYAERPGDAEALSSRGFIPVSQRSVFAANCSAVPAYGYIVDCDSSEAFCKTATRVDGQISLSDGGNCGSYQSGAQGQLAQEAGLLPSQPSENPLDSCYKDPDTSYGWLVDCEQNPDDSGFICLGVGDSTVTTASAADCAGYTPRPEDAERFAPFTDNGTQVYSDAQKQTTPISQACGVTYGWQTLYDYIGCDEEIEQANAHVACVRDSDNKVMTGADEALCTGARPGGDGVQTVGACHRYYDMRPDTSTYWFCNDDNSPDQQGYVQMTRPAGNPTDAALTADEMNDYCTAQNAVCCSYWLRSYPPDGQWIGVVQAHLSVGSTPTYGGSLYSDPGRASAATTLSGWTPVDGYNRYDYDNWNDGNGEWTGGGGGTVQ